MSAVNKRWILRAPDDSRAASLARVLNVSPIVAALLLARGCDDESSARAFLKPTYESTSRSLPDVRDERRPWRVCKKP